MSKLPEELKRIEEQFGGSATDALNFLYREAGADARYAADLARQRGVAPLHPHSKESRLYYRAKMLRACIRLIEQWDPERRSEGA